MLNSVLLFFKIETFISLLSVLIGVPTCIYYLLKLMKYRHKKKDTFTMYLPTSESYCFGRNEEKKIIKEHILSSKTIFVFGTVGIGKTTVIRQSIDEIESKIRKKYKKVLYHKFKANGDTSFEFACDKLSHQIDGSGLKSIETLLNEGDYLIWLDECENTDCLDKLFNISYRPVYIVTSRNKEQENVISSSIGGNNISLLINTLPIKDGERMLSHRYFFKYFYKHHSTNRAIVKLFNGHPLILDLIKNNYLYKSNPEIFLKKYKDDINQFKIHNPVRYQEMVCKDLVISSLGLAIDMQVEVLSTEAKRALGFLGCISFDEFLIIDKVFDNVFCNGVIEELIQTKLVNVHKGFIRIKHSLIHEVLHENIGKLLGDNYEPLFNFIQTIDSVYATRKDGDKNLTVAIYVYLRHLLDVIKYVIQNHLHTNSDEELYLCCGLNVLADFGFYEDVLSLTEQYAPIHNQNEGYPYYSLARTISFKGSGNYHEAIACAKEFYFSIPIENFGIKLNAIHNLIYLYTSSGNYDDAIKTGEKTFNYVRTQNIEKKEQYYPCFCEIESYLREAVWHNCSDENLKDYIPEQIELIKKMEGTNDCDKTDILDAKLILAFSYARLGYEIFAIKIYVEIINSIRQWFSFFDPYSINMLFRIAHFYHINDNYDQANALYCEILPLSEELFGNGHIITEKIRSEYDKNKKQQEKIGIDKSKIHFTIKRAHQQNMFYTIIKNLHKRLAKAIQLIIGISVCLFR